MQFSPSGRWTKQSTLRREWECSSGAFMGNLLTYQDVEARFEPDGGWRDIYAFQTTDVEWSALLAVLLAGRWHTELRVNDEPSTDIKEAVRTLDSVSDHAGLTVSLPGATLNCQFFTTSQIEFDLDPSEIGPSNFGALCEFISLMSNATARNVFITEESSSESGIFARVAATQELLLLTRPERSTSLAESLRERLREVLRPFELLEPQSLGYPRESLPDPADAVGACEAASHFVASVFQPDSLECHTALTTAEYCALDRLDTAFGIFLGSCSVEELCRTGGFKVSQLRYQFWNSVVNARSVFACMPTERRS